MVEMSLEEAQLFRMLGAFFGRERVVWNMSVRAVCGGDYPALDGESQEGVADWAEVSACLFTIVDEDDNRKMVVEFAPNLSDCIEVKQLDRHERLPSLLLRRGVEYLSLSAEQFNEIVDPNGSLDLISILKDKFGIHDSVETDTGRDEGE